MLSRPGLRQCLHGPQQRRLFVQRLARPRTERRGYAQRGPVGVFENIGRTGHVPGRVAARFKRRPDPARRKTRRVRLAPDQLLRRKLRQRPALAVRLEKAVVLFGRQPRQRIEHVSVMRRPLLDRPVPHRHRHFVGHRHIQLLALVDRPPQRLVHPLRQPRLHHPVVKHVRPENLARRRLGKIQRRGRRPVVRHRRYRIQSGYAHLSASFLFRSLLVPIRHFGPG
jgi:hypothetical protein